MNVLYRELNGGRLSHWRKIDAMNYLQDHWGTTYRTAQRWVYGEVPLKSHTLEIAKRAIEEMVAIEGVGAITSKKSLVELSGLRIDIGSCGN